MTSEYVLVIGAVTSLLMTELLSVSPGGVIVPGFLALYLDSPLRIASTLGAATLAFLGARLAGRHLILFGRRRYAAFLLAGFLARFILEGIIPGLLPELPLYAAVGWLLPGIIASEADRQGLARTFLALAACTFIVKIIWMLAV